jgi:hypothetical protein
VRNACCLGAPWRNGTGAWEDVEGIELTVDGLEGGRDIRDITVPKQLLKHGTLWLVQRLGGVHVVNPLGPNILDTNAGSNSMSTRTGEGHGARDGQVVIG